MPGRTDGRDWLSYAWKNRGLELLLRTLWDTLWIWVLGEGERKERGDAEENLPLFVSNYFSLEEVEINYGGFNFDFLNQKI